MPVKILLIAFEFPPLASAGVQRSLKFAKYLAEFGIHPVVVTTDLDGFKQAISEYPIDESLLADLPASLEIERIPFIRRKTLQTGRFHEWRRIFFSLVEDLAEQWSPEFNNAMEALVEKHQPRAIYVSLPPFCMAHLGCALAKRYNLPLILDFRDAWSQWRISPYGSWFHYWLTRRVEGQFLRLANKLVCTSNQTREDFLRVHPKIPSGKISVIPNGYDQPIDDWTLGYNGVGPTFVIGYVGAFYYHPSSRDAMMRPWWNKRLNRMIQYSPRREDWLYRSPLFFFKAVARLLKNSPELRQRLKIRFAGTKPSWIDAQVSQFGLNDIVEFVGRLDHPSVLRFQQECDALLVTSSKVVGGKDYSIAGKTYEYFTMRKPILGFVAPGSQKELLENSGMALVCDPDNSVSSSEQLLALITGQCVFKPNVVFLQQLHRRELTHRLGDLIKSVVKHPEP